MNMSARETFKHKRNYQISFMIILNYSKQKIYFIMVILNSHYSSLVIFVSFTAIIVERKKKELSFCVFSSSEI